MAIVILFGIVIAYLDEQVFRDSYVPEDGLLEYFTAVLLFCSGMMSLWRLIAIRGARGS